jgi:hypothetical protein
MLCASRISMYLSEKFGVYMSFCSFKMSLAYGYSVDFKSIHVNR